MAATRIFMTKESKRQLELREEILAIIIFGFLTVALLGVLVWQLFKHEIYMDLFIYVGFIVASAWWAFSFALVYLILRFLPRRVAQGISAAIFIILTFLVGVFGSIILGADLGYPKIVPLLIYLSVPFLFSTILLVVHLFKNHIRKYSQS